MTRLKKISTLVLLLLGAVVTAWAAYHLGYRSGLAARDDARVTISIRRSTGPGQSSTSCLWFDLAKPDEARKFRDTLRSLRQQGADYYVAEPRIEISYSPMPDPRRVNAVFSGSEDGPSPEN